MVYKVSSCFFSFFGEFLFLIVAQLELGLTPFTEDLRCKLHFTVNSRTYNSSFVSFTEDRRTYYFMHAVVGPTIPCMLPFH